MIHERIEKLLLSTVSAVMIISSVTWPVSVRATETANNKITNFSLQASSEYNTNRIDKAKDGDKNTFWESNWADSNNSRPSEEKPIVVTATFTEPTKVGVMRIVPRQGNDSNKGDQNGRIKKAKYTMLNNNDEVIKEETKVYFTGEQVPTDENIDVEINATVKKVKIEILSAYSTTATMAELEFYKESDSWYSNVEATTAHNDHAIAKAFDNNPDTFWHSNWANGAKVNAEHPADVTITRKNTTPMH